MRAGRLLCNRVIFLRQWTSRKQSSETEHYFPPTHPLRKITKPLSSPLRLLKIFSGADVGKATLFQRLLSTTSTPFKNRWNCSGDDSFAKWHAILHRMHPVRAHPKLAGERCSPWPLISLSEKGNCETSAGSFFVSFSDSLGKCKRALQSTPADIYLRILSAMCFLSLTGHFEKCQDTCFHRYSI